MLWLVSFLCVQGEMPNDSEMRFSVSEMMRRTSALVRISFIHILARPPWVLLDGLLKIEVSNVFLVCVGILQSRETMVTCSVCGIWNSV